MRINITFYIICLFVCVLLLFGCNFKKETPSFYCNSTVEIQKIEQNSKISVGDTIPFFLGIMEDGKEVDIPKMKGKPTLVYFIPFKGNNTFLLNERIIDVGIDYNPNFNIIVLNDIKIGNIYGVDVKDDEHGTLFVTDSELRLKKILTGICEKELHSFLNDN